MTAGMGQLGALKHVQINGRSVLAQTRVLSTVSVGSWVGQTFSYLRGDTADDALLNRYVADPGRLVPSEQTRVYLALGATDMRKQIDGLAALVEDVLGACVCICRDMGNGMVAARWHSPAGRSGPANALQQLLLEGIDPDRRDQEVQAAEAVHTLGKRRGDDVGVKDRARAVADRVRLDTAGECVAECLQLPSTNRSARRP